MGRKLSLAERIAIFIITFLVVVIVMSNMRIWQIGFQKYFFQAEKWPELIFLFLLVTAISMIFTKLLQWAFRVQVRRR